MSPGRKVALELVERRLWIRQISASLSHQQHEEAPRSPSSRRRIAGRSLIDSSELANQSCKPNQGSLLFYTSLRMRSYISSA